MSVVIRMQRAGGRNRPFYRVVVADSRAMRDGRFLEKVGFYNPLTNPAVVDIDEERVRYWVDRGAKPSDSVASLMRRSRKGLTRTSAMPSGQAPVAAAAPVVKAERPAPVVEAEQPAPVVEAEQPAPVVEAERPAPVVEAEQPALAPVEEAPAPSLEPATPEDAPAAPVAESPADAAENPEPQRSDEN